MNRPELVNDEKLGTDAGRLANHFRKKSNAARSGAVKLGNPRHAECHLLLILRAHHCFDCADPIDLNAHLVI